MAVGISSLQALKKAFSKAWPLVSTSLLNLTSTHACFLIDGEKVQTRGMARTAILPHLQHLLRHRADFAAYRCLGREENNQSSVYKFKSPSNRVIGVRT